MLKWPVFGISTDMLINQYISLGASIHDVHTEGGGGVSPKEDEVREVA